MKLSNEKKYAIQGMIADEKTIPEMAKILKVTEKIIQNYINTLADSVSKIKDNIATFGFINETDNGKRGVTVMTEVASQKGDGQSKSKPIQNPRTKNTIYNIKEKTTR